MEVKVCKNCRRLFNYIYGPDLCPECNNLVNEERLAPADKRSNTAVKPLVREEETKYEQVKLYITTHPKASVAQIAEVNDITPSKLFEWIRDERLEFSEDCEFAWFTCERCGAKIKSGRLCNRCKTYQK